VYPSVFKGFPLATLIKGAMSIGTGHPPLYASALTLPNKGVTKLKLVFGVAEAVTNPPISQQALS